MTGTTKPTGNFQERNTSYAPNMPGRLDFEEYGEAIGAAWTVLREHATRTDRDASVPTCPGWTVADLVAHQAMVHRWVAATLRHERIDTDAVLAQGLAAADLGAWLDAGAKELLQALVDARDEEGRFFLRDADRPKLAWARRQAHETAIHAVDAMASRLGRVPSARETWLSPRVAADGVDEFLTGFAPQRLHGLRSAAPRRVHVLAADVDVAWTLEVGEDPVVTTRGRVGDPDITIRGSAVALHLWSWNRGGPGDEVDIDGVLPVPWSEAMRVNWQ